MAKLKSEIAEIARNSLMTFGAALLGGAIGYHVGGFVAGRIVMAHYHSVDQMGEALLLAICMPGLGLALGLYFGIKLYRWALARLGW